MAFNSHQFRDLVERTLQERNLYSESAVNLLLGTMAQESCFGSYLKQLGNGPALSIFQMEELTFDDLQNRFGKKFPWMKEWKFEEIEWDLKKAILMCRIKYYSIPGPLPPADNLRSLAAYWKKWYNTPLGAGTVQEFIDNYYKYGV